MNTNLHEAALHLYTTWFDPWLIKAYRTDPVVARAMKRSAHKLESPAVMMEQLAKDLVAANAHLVASLLNRPPSPTFIIRDASSVEEAAESQISNRKHMKPTPKLIIVIHVKNTKQAIQQTKCALDCGAGGVFLIDHARPWDQLLTTFKAVRREFPDAWLGINYLDLDPRNAIRECPTHLDGLWMDTTHGLEPHDIPAERRWQLFGGVAFKYKDTGLPIAEEVAQVAPLCDILTTSGPSTAAVASMVKVKKVKAAAAKHGKTIALASGVSDSNVQSYSAYASHFLVASSVAESFHVLNPDKLKSLVASMR